MSYFILFLVSFFLLFLNSPLFAQTAANANVCAQKQCVKIQNGYLWTLSSDNATYTPYFVKAVGYAPTPIGRYPSDWGYSLSDPRSINNNIYDDPNILNRDFSLLRQMNANTIRIWNGAKLILNGRFPNYITNAGNTSNKDTTKNTLDLAASYGLKVIPGFWINPVGFDANNNISDNSGNTLNRQAIINNFVNYVNTFKGNRAILFWAIGNENNYQVVNGRAVPITAFENAFGTSNGDTIYNWLREVGNILDYNGDILLDMTLSSTVNIIMKQYPSNYNSIVNLLKQYSGQPFTPPQLTAWYSLINAMAQAAHNAEGAFFHPVAVVNGETTNIGIIADGTTDAQLPYIDIWGANVYRGQSFGTLFTDYASKSKKPLWISEFGVDAWSVTNAANTNNWGLTLGADQGGTGMYDPARQASWDGSLWNEILSNSPKTLGGSLMEYSDEWWKPYEFYCTSPSTSQYYNAISTAICNSNQKYFGFPNTVSPDSFSNEEWYGVMSISPNGASGSPDIMTPRPVYTNLQAQWQANPWATLNLNINGSGAGTISSTSSLGAGFNCNFSSGSSTGNCSTAFTKNQPVTLTFSANGNSTVTNWGINGCASGSSVCHITPGADTTLNVTITAPPAISAGLGYYVYSYTAPASVYLSAYGFEAGGTISKIQFYNGATLINTVTALAVSGAYRTYSYIWNNLTAGSYSLTIKVYDSNNNTVTSAPVNFTITGPRQITCGANMYFNPQTSSCACDQYTYYTGTGCAYCPEGQTSYNGASCVPVVCPANMYYDTTPGTSGYNTCQCVAGTKYTTGPGCVF